jgi:anti-sigma regulatory factor (Ser/Thr protein kinase)
MQGRPVGLPERMLRIDMSSDVTWLPLVRSALELFVRRIIGRRELLLRMEVPVVEAVVNAIRHANGEDQAKRVILEFEWEPPRVIVRVLDEGPPFAARIPEVPVHGLDEEGRGLFLMSSMSDDIEVLRRNGGNQVILSWAVARRGGAS